MRAVLLDGSLVGDAAGARVADEMFRALRAAGYDVERLVARELDVRACAGCFGCWTKHPGECVIDDDARDVAAKVIAAEVYAVVGPVRFGTYDWRMKRAMDRMIGLLLPFFTMVRGEVHHVQRYPRHPALVAIGTVERHDVPTERTFETLVERNAVNLHAPAHAVSVIAAEDDAAGAVRAALDAIGVRTGVAA